MDITHILNIVSDACFYLCFPKEVCNREDVGENLQTLIAEIKHLRNHDLWADQPATPYQQKRRNEATLHVFEEIDKNYKEYNIKDRPLEHELQEELFIELNTFRYILQNASRETYKVHKAIIDYGLKGIDVNTLKNLMKIHTWEYLLNFIKEYTTYENRNEKDTHIYETIFKYVHIPDGQQYHSIFKKVFACMNEEIIYNGDKAKSIKNNMKRRKGQNK